MATQYRRILLLQRTELSGISAQRLVRDFWVAKLKKERGSYAHMSVFCVSRIFAAASSSACKIMVGFENSYRKMHVVLYFTVKLRANLD
jgi:hypothetical protein